MTDELFPTSTVAVESPRLAWIQKHDIELRDSLGSVKLRCAYARTGPGGYGDSDDDALVDWARRNGVRLWNETEIAS